MNEILAKYGTFIMIAVWIAIIYFFMILPNKKKCLILLKKEMK